jgi:hypothetical protein
MSQKREFIPHWFLRLFGFKAGSISVDKDGVTLKLGEKSYLIDNHSLARKNAIRKGWLGSSLIFNTNQGEVEFGPHLRSKIEDAYEWLQK